MAELAAEEFDRAASLEEVYKLLARARMENGWAKPEPSMWAAPRRRFEPAHWPYDHARKALDAAGRFVNTELAERRNLILANPIPGNKYPTVPTLVAAYQMVKAGEIARSHRHTANALRLVLDTRPGAYTIVDGMKIPMVPGDVLLTPNWSWHAHSNESDANAYWMDFLDVPLVHLLNPMFFEHHEEKVEQAKGIAETSPMRFSWDDTVARLAAAPETAPGVREIALGGPSPMATIALHVTRFDASTALTREPTTASSIVAVMQGKGHAEISGCRFSFARGDALAVPAGCSQTWTADGECYLLRVTDEPVLSKLGWLRATPEAPVAQK